MAKNNLRMIAVKRDIYAQLVYLKGGKVNTFNKVMKLLIDEYYKDVVHNEMEYRDIEEIYGLRGH